MDVCGFRTALSVGTLFPPNIPFCGIARLRTDSTVMIMIMITIILIIIIIIMIIIIMI